MMPTKAELVQEIESLKDAQIFAEALNVLYKKYLAGSGVIPNGVNLYKFVTADLSNNGMYIVNDQFVKQY